MAAGKTSARSGYPGRAGTVSGAPNLGLLHHDVKPANILFVDLRTVIVGFGLAGVAKHALLPLITR